MTKKLIAFWGNLPIFIFKQNKNIKIDANTTVIDVYDIKIIKDAFINRVSTMYHSRVVYPEDKNSSQQPNLPKL